VIGKVHKEIGQGWSDSPPAQSFVKSIPINIAPTFEGYDISLVSLSTDPLSLINIYEDAPDWFKFCYGRLLFEIEIKNVGEKPIHSFSYASKRDHSFNCSEGRLY